MQEELNEERLGKIVELAKKGERGERDAAMRIVKKLCQKHKLNFDDVMAQREKIQKFLIECKVGEEEVLAQTVFRYGVANRKSNVWTIRSGKGIRFEGTQTTYLETLNAWEVLSRVFRKEKKKTQEALFYAFIGKHDLFYKLKEGEKPARKTKEPEKETDPGVLRMASSMVSGLDDAEINKSLKSGK